MKTNIWWCEYRRSIEIDTVCEQKSIKRLIKTFTNTNMVNHENNFVSTDNGSIPGTTARFLPSWFPRLSNDGKKLSFRLKKCVNCIGCCKWT